MTRTKKPKKVPPKAYTLEDCGLPFARTTWYRWEKLGLIKLLRVGAKTLVSAETVDGILDGSIKLPQNAGHSKPPVPLDRGGHTKAGRRKPKPEPPEQPAAPAE